MDNLNIFKKIFEIMDYFESISNNLPNEKNIKMMMIFLILFFKMSRK